jgi:hypothetical protein
MNSGRRDRHPELVVLDLFGNGDLHCSPIFVVGFFGVDGGLWAPNGPDFKNIREPDPPSRPKAACRAGFPILRGEWRRFVRSQR